MRAYLDDITATYDCGIYSTTLVALLTIPDLCGAVDAPTQRAGPRYIKWFNDNATCYDWPALKKGDGIEPRLIFNGEAVLKYRNALLGGTEPDLGQFGYQRIVVATPTRDHNALELFRSQDGDNLVLNIHLTTFCNDLLTGARRWLDTAETDERATRITALVQPRPNGIGPHMIGLPVIA